MDNLYESAHRLGQCLLKRQWHVTTAESCTGGGIAYALTEVPGSSSWFSHGFVTYSNAAKGQLLSVSSDIIEQHGAVSEHTVLAMAVGAREQSGAQLAVAVSGIAGPDGGSADKPVGTVWFAGDSINDRITACQHFTGDRHSVRNQAISFALNMILFPLASQG